jgi:aspartate aminotransferase-like enzyme
MHSHTRLFIPGPVEVRQSVLNAQSTPMIGHRGKEFETLFANIQRKLKQVFFSSSRVFISTSSGTGLWEAAIRNCVADDASPGILATVCGAFSERWADVCEKNGKPVTRLTVAEGQPITPELLDEMIKNKSKAYSAILIVHNETSCGLTNPLHDLVMVIKQNNPETLILVDAVSSLGGVKIDFDALGIDVLLTSSQKCFGLPPGLAFASVSDRVLERAKNIKNRGYYFDFLELEAALKKNNTPATPAISLMQALDCQLDDMLTEGLERRYARHAHLAKLTQAWVLNAGFGLFAHPAYLSNTVTCVANTRNINVPKLNNFLVEHGYQISEGYGKLKDKTFRIAHMGDTTENEMKGLLEKISVFVK